jgi:hypothetical protein
MQGGGVWGRGMHGSPEALPHKEVGSEAMRCAATPEPSRTGGLGLVLRVTRKCVAARPASRHSLELVHGGTGL